MYNVHVLSGWTATTFPIQKPLTEEGYVTTMFACEVVIVNNC